MDIHLVDDLAHGLAFAMGPHAAGIGSGILGRRSRDALDNGVILAGDMRQGQRNTIASL